VTTHPQFEEDLALYAMGVLGEEDRLNLEHHLADCPSCRRELEALRGDSALLALSTGGPRPPQRSRERLMKAIAQEPRRVEARRSRPWWALVPAFAAGLLAVLAGWLLTQNSSLKQQVQVLKNRSLKQQAELQRTREIVSTLTATDAMTVTLVAAKTPPQPQGKVMYMKDRGGLIFLASNLPPVPSQKAYELWLIPVQGAPMPAGVFKPDTHGSATVLNPPLTPGVEAKAFAITVEPEAGSATPTMPIVMVGGE
jgi:anti-sigma-K factor RskA